MASKEEKRWPGMSDENHPKDFVSIPDGDLKPSKPGQLSQEQVKQFFEKGYVVVDEFFKPEELQPIKDDINDLVEVLAQKLHKAGKIKNLHSEHGLFQRLTKLEEEFPGASIVMHKIGQMPKPVCDLWSNERMLNLVEQLLGTTEVMGSPVWNLRTKTPRCEATVVPWHQDASYFEVKGYKHLIITAWIPLLNATEANGCLQVVPGGHRKGRVATHQCCQGGTWYTMLDEDEMRKTLDVDPDTSKVTCEIPYRGLLLFNNLLPHRSLTNLSGDIRWALDLRWQRASDPISFFDLKEGVLLRSKDPEHKPDWDKFNGTDRHQASLEELGLEYDEFDTTIQGPWMHQWEITHINRHTDAFYKAQGQGIAINPEVVG